MKEPLPASTRERLAALFREGRYGELEKAARRLLRRQPSGELWQALGVARQMLGKNALPALRKAARLLPEVADAHYNLGNALHAAGRFRAACRRYRRALQIRPDDAEIHYNLGAALHALGRYRAALASHRQALALAPDHAEAHYNQGNTLAAQGRYAAAATAYREALRHAPRHVSALHNLGNALRELGQLDEAVRSYRRALEISPDLHEAHSNLLFAANFLPAAPPAERLAPARRYGELVARLAQPRKDWTNPPDPARRLRIGLVSGDLRRHPVGYFLTSVLAALAADPASRLCFYAYANQTDDDALSKRLRAACRRWRQVDSLDDRHLAARIVRDRIDILIDLPGHTAANRLPLFAWKPAPVQLTWLGYFATSGVAAIDYLLADPWTLPASEEAAYSEKIHRLPETRLCFATPRKAPPVGPLPALKNGWVTFGSFANLAKIDAAVVATWAQILHAVPASRLFLKAHQLDEAELRAATQARFAAHGIAAQRLILEGADAHHDYLAAWRRVDIALDTFPYSGATVSAESLWMGVPVLTLAGRRMVERQGVGILMNVGLPDWIADDVSDYVAKAAAHAADLAQLAKLRRTLRQRLRASPLCDAPRFARHFEQALREMWEAWCEK